MPDNRTEPTPGAGEDAASAPADFEPASSRGGFKAWLPLLVTWLLTPVLAYVVAIYVLLPRLQKGLGIPVQAREAGSIKTGRAGADAKRESYIMNKLLVNVAGTLGARYLLVSISVVSSDPGFKTKMEAHDPQLRDMACGALAIKTLADLEKPGARNLIRSELIAGFNNILGGAVVQEIYLTEFAIQ
jgi:flagellar FliL protein